MAELELKVNWAKLKAFDCSVIDRIETGDKPQFSDLKFYERWHLHPGK